MRGEEKTKEKKECKVWSCKHYEQLNREPEICSTCPYKYFELVEKEPGKDRYLALQEVYSRELKEELAVINRLRKENRIIKAITYMLSIGVLGLIMLLLL